MRNLVTLSVFSIFAGTSSAQTLGSILDAGDIYADSLRVSSTGNTDSISSPFNFGFLETATGVLRTVPPVEFQTGNNGSVQQQNDLFSATPIQPTNTNYESQIWWNFSPGGWDIAGLVQVPAASIVFYEEDVIPAVEAKIPKGTYTFHATATPTAATSTPALLSSRQTPRAFGRPASR